MTAPARLALALGSVHDRPFSELLAIAGLAESCGYEALFMPEAWGRDAFVTLGALAARTERINLGTGIVNIYSRSPALLAMAAATLDEVSGGRAILGLGTSGQRVIEGWHNVPMARPLRRLRETTEAVRLITARSRRGYDGLVVKVAPGFALTLPPTRGAVPIWHASLTPAAIRQAGEVADGWLPYLTSPETLRVDLALAGEGLAKAGRERVSFTAAPYVPALVGDDAATRELVRGHLAFYLGAMGRFYREAVARHGFAAEAEEVRLRWEARDRAAAVAAVSDALLDAFAAAGPMAHCRARLDAYRAAGADLPVVALPGDCSSEAAERTIRALAPA